MMRAMLQGWMLILGYPGCVQPLSVPPHPQILDLLKLVFREHFHELRLSVFLRPFGFVKELLKVFLLLRLSSNVFRRLSGCVMNYIHHSLDKRWFLSVLLWSERSRFQVDGDSEVMFVWI